MGTLETRAMERVSGPAWDGLRDKFLAISHHLLAASPESFAELTTIYVKFTITKEPTSPVSAAIWLKNSKSLTVGLALPDEFQHALLRPPPQEMKYKGLTSYFTITPEDDVPEELQAWSMLTYRNVLLRKPSTGQDDLAD